MSIIQTKKKRAEECALEKPHWALRLGLPPDNRGTRSVTQSEQKPAKIPPFAPEFVKGVCDVLAQTDFPGLSGSEIDSLLQMVRVTEREPGGNKRESLYITLYNVQVRQQAGNVVGGFIAKAMSLSRYAAQPARFTDLRDQLNEFLIFHGYSINEDGKLAAGTKASSMSEGAALAGRLHTELMRRGCHAELLRYCDEELINRSLFHAMSEASKSIPSRVRSITGLAGDGAVLFDGVFGTNREHPLWSINAHRSDSEISEHRGFKNLLVGVHGHFRNPRAHSSRITRDEVLVDFYDAFSLFSYIHRRLDSMNRLLPEGGN
ncbi:TIGR02391 family protein [Mycolicibacterium sp. P9-64]|uniref:TIGR02391 family protein n=1 Tax=Mycolicibacterium sp. P9-64 TaxID=2024612 RepID=UPI0011EEA665|nr:TIGR02391 family protein [Mycolicibacterium sp. P9-64]KAA0085577.1 TIGR02391 family protein [Mycolicibacterium sp. P9-64]